MSTFFALLNLKLVPVSTVRAEVDFCLKNNKWTLENNIKRCAQSLTQSKVPIGGPLRHFYFDKS